MIPCPQYVERENPDLLLRGDFYIWVMAFIPNPLTRTYTSWFCDGDCFNDLSFFHLWELSHSDDPAVNRCFMEHHSVDPQEVHIRSLGRASPPIITVSCLEGRAQTYLILLPVKKNLEMNYANVFTVTIHRPASQEDTISSLNWRTG